MEIKNYEISINSNTNSTNIEKTLKDPAAIRKKIKEIVEQVKPEFLFFSTIRRATFMVINVDDPLYSCVKFMKPMQNMEL